MKRVGFVFKIKKESIDEYKEHHKKQKGRGVQAAENFLAQALLVTVTCRICLGRLKVAADVTSLSSRVPG